MKNILLKPANALLLVLLTLFTVMACRDNNDDITSQASKPEITLVSASVIENEDGTKTTVDPLEETHVGYANNMYVIVGKGFASLKHIYFNDYEASFNPNLVTDTHIFVTVDKDTPYDADASKKLKIETAFGTAEYDFIIAPPAPVFGSFDPVNAADGDEVTIYGNYFVDPVVMVGDQQAEIESYDLTRIKIKLPQGSQGKQMTITTLSGTVTWNTAVGTALFDDIFYGDFKFNSMELVVDPATAYQGNVYIKKKMSAWGNMESNWGWNEDAVKKYTGIKFAVRSDGAGQLVMIFNGKYWGDSSRAFKTTSTWKEVTYKWSDLDNPQALQYIAFQEFSGQETTYYFDNFTFTTD